MKKLIFGPIIRVIVRIFKAIDAFFNPCPPAPNPYWDLPRPGAFHQKLFLS